MAPVHDLGALEAQASRTPPFRKDRCMKTVTPCWPIGAPCPNACAARRMDHLTRNHVELTGPWTGWRLAGKDLVSPSGQRVSPERMRGLLWRLEAEERRDRLRSRNASRKAVRQGIVTVIRVANEDWHRHHFGTCAG
ncbi:hypothetical protein EA658_06180 [Pseudoxanthomonas winnipegensis]|uniref:Transposase n=2 Tax=Pseudoxanthomonas winnipegensis TaxID=2480810 RepID=A0ABY1WF81_9GAMM|nr:hypothetical protein EA658_06180 [Pseudoxanthomonas winnipegensis]